MNEYSTNREKDGLPKRENYEDEDQWDENMLQYFTDRVVITEEELEAYRGYRTSRWESIPEEDSIDFELDGKYYEVVVLKFPDDRPSYDWYTRIFVIKKK